MNTVTDLRTELDRLAECAPSEAEVRKSLTDRIARHAKRRRTTALLAAAAAVVVVAGGAGVAGAVLSHRSAGPAGPTPVVQVPQIPLPPDTKLIRHQLQPVTTPVTAIPPQGLTGRVWFSSPGRLAVDWFDLGRGAAFGWSGESAAPGSASAAGPRAAGYVVTATRDEALTTVGSDGPVSATVSRRDITVGGHPATLETAPAGTTNEIGMPAEERITWQLADGRWIHVWTEGLAPDPGALESFAGGITEAPQTLDRTVGIGLTLPGLTVDSSINSSPLASELGADIYLCPAGVDPFASSSGTSSGSGSTPAVASAVASASIAPGEPTGSTTTETQTENDPTSGCVAAAVINAPGQQPGGTSSAPATTVTVGDTIAHVDRADGLAWADLGDGLTAVARAPQSTHLSAGDLAALVASVRLSPAVTVLPVQTPYVTQGPVEATAVTMASAVKAVPPSGVSLSSSRAATAPVTAATNRPGGVISSAEAAESSVSSAARSVSSARSAVSSAQAGSTAAAVLAKYLDALTVGDCATAHQLVASTFVWGNGELCGSVHVSAHSAPTDPASPGPDERDFAITLTTDGSADGSIPAGKLLWFYILQRQPDGQWLITGGGSGP